MSKTTAFVGTLTIPNGETESNIVSIKQGIGVIGIMIVAPAALTGTVSIRGSMANADTPANIYVDGNAMTLTAASVEQFRIAGLKKIQIVSGSAEDAARTAKVYALFDARGIC